jgi:hypothetical protein
MKGIAVLRIKIVEPTMPHKLNKLSTKKLLETEIAAATGTVNPITNPLKK